MEWLSGLTGFADTLVNKHIADQNLNFQRENLAYQKELQQQIFQREDNAVQRRADDLQKAGLSKTLAAGSGAGAGSIVSTSAPQNQFKSNLQNVVGNMASIAQSFQDVEKTKLENSILAHDASIITGEPDVISNIQKSSEYQIANAISMVLYGKPLSGLGKDAGKVVKEVSGLGSDTVKAFSDVVNSSRNLKFDFTNPSPIKKDTIGNAVLSSVISGKAYEPTFDSSVAKTVSGNSVTSKTIEGAKQATDDFIKKNPQLTDKEIATIRRVEKALAEKFSKLI